MAKQQKVEVSIERYEFNSAQFIMFDESSNKPKYRSIVYTKRSNAIRGAIRYAIRNKFKISRWLK